MRRSLMIAAVCAGILLVCTKTPVQTSGTASETDTAMIYNPDNTPAVGAVVRFFVATDSTRTIAYQTTTDAHGRYSTKALAKGTYNLFAYSARGTSKVLATNDSLIAYQDSILVLADTVLVQPDTLEKPGSITGIIGLQPNHDPRTATVQVLGTDLYSNVDINGRFTLAPVAKGSYNLRLVTTLADYTPTYTTIQTAGQKKDTLSDTLWLLYTGIPVVTGLAAAYDTVNGVVHLSWNKAAYRDFQDYLIFRDAYDSIVLSTNPVAARSDTFFVDSVFKRGLDSAQFSFNDTNDYHFKYRVCVENSSSVRGAMYGNVSIVAASPANVKTSFQFTFFHLAKQFFTDSASINDSVRCSVKLSNPTRQLRSLVWNDIVMGKAVRTVTLDSTKKAANDSMIYMWNSVGEKGLTCAVTDMAGKVWKDTARIEIVKDAPVVRMTCSPDTIAIGGTIHISMNAIRRYGKIVKVEWDIGNTGQFSLGAMKDSVSDTAVVASMVPDTGWLCIVRVTDDDGTMVLDTLGIKVNMFVSATNSVGFTWRTGHSSVVFNNKMWLIAGLASTQSVYPSDAWYSEDGTLWLPATRQAAFQGRWGHTSLVFDNKIWVIGGGNDGGLLNDVWFSSDGSTWTQSTSTAQFSRRMNHTSVVFNGRMWVIGGRGSSNFNDVWYSTDGVAWTLATANAGFSPRNSHSSIVFNNEMWVIAGDDNSGSRSDVWYSTDGIIWTLSTANAGFSPRYGHSSIVFNNEMWVIAGDDNSGPISDVWYSTDGVTWIQATSNSGFSPRYGHSSLTFGNGMWVIGGFSAGGSLNGLTIYIPNSDVWYSSYSPK
jgi:Kelch motif